MLQHRSKRVQVYSLLIELAEQNTPSAAITRQDESATQGAEAKAVKLQRKNNNTSLKKQQSEVMQ